MSTQTTQPDPREPQRRANLSVMDTAAPITGTNYYDVTRDALAVAQDGDYRARRIAVGSRAGIVTPQRTAAGQLDRNDLAAQIYALCHGLTSTTGRYTDGAFTSDGDAYCIPAPDLS